MQKVFIKTYGCQMNVYDSDRMFDVLNKMQIQHTEDITEADLILLNTCSIREKAQEKVFSEPVSYTHLTLPTRCHRCRSRWSPYH